MMLLMMMSTQMLRRSCSLTIELLGTDLVTTTNGAHARFNFLRTWFRRHLQKAIATRVEDEDEQMHLNWDQTV